MRNGPFTMIGGSLEKLTKIDLRKWPYRHDSKNDFGYLYALESANIKFCFTDIFYTNELKMMKQFKCVRYYFKTKEDLNLFLILKSK